MTQLLLPLGRRSRALAAVARGTALGPARIGSAGDTRTAEDAARVLQAHIDAGVLDYAPCRWWVDTLCAMMEAA